MSSEIAAERLMIIANAERRVALASAELEAARQTLKVRREALDLAVAEMRAEIRGEDMTLFNPPRESEE